MREKERERERGRHKQKGMTEIDIIKRTEREDNIRYKG